MAVINKTSKSSAKKTAVQETPITGRTRSRATSAPATRRAAAPATQKNETKQYFGKVWINLSKYSKLTDDQLEKANRFIEEVILPNFYLKLSVDNDVQDGVVLMPSDNILFAQKRKKMETDADFSAYVKVDEE